LRAQIKEGDVVTVGQCRPLSKTVRFNVLKVESATEAGAARAKKTFRVF
jgi:small subunit ribosomal protein S11e